MGNDIIIALVLAILFAILLGIVYPLAMTGVGYRSRSRLGGEQVRAPVDRHVEHPPIAAIGEDRADVLPVDRALDHTSEAR